jgi:hypothetical protein
MGTEELYDSLLAHVSLAPFVQPVNGVDLRVSVRILNPLDVTDKEFPSGGVVGEVAEGVRRVTNVTGDKPEVVAVLLVCTF